MTGIIRDRRSRAASSPALLHALVTLIVLTAHAPILASGLFGGGMALHGSYVNFDAPQGHVEGAMTGLGGRLHFNLGRYFRAGGLGAVVKVEYDDKGSYFELGYGGISAEATYRLSQMQISAGAAVGGGAVTHLAVVTVSADDEISGQFERYGTFIVAPMIGVEFFVGKTISLILGIDYLVGARLGSGHSLGGPKMQVGVLFNK